MPEIIISGGLSKSEWIPICTQSAGEPSTVCISRPFCLIRSIRMFPNRVIALLIQLRSWVGTIVLIGARVDKASIIHHKGKSLQLSNKHIKNEFYFSLKYFFYKYKSKFSCWFLVRLFLPVGILIRRLVVYVKRY